MTVTNVQAPERLVAVLALVWLAEAPGLDRGLLLAGRAWVAWQTRAPRPGWRPRPPRLRALAA